MFKCRQDTVQLEKIDNGYVVTLEGRNSDGDWKTVKIFEGTLSDCMEKIESYFILPND